MQGVGTYDYVPLV